MCVADSFENLDFDTRAAIRRKPGDEAHRMLQHVERIAYGKPSRGVAGREDQVLNRALRLMRLLEVHR